jgi:hypothetical protein
VVKTAVARASSEADMTKFVRGSWPGQRSVQSRKGKQCVLRWQSGDGCANRKRQHIGSDNAKLLVNVRRRLLHAAAQLHRRPILLLSFSGCHIIRPVLSIFSLATRCGR